MIVVDVIEVDVMWPIGIVFTRSLLYESPGNATSLARSVPLTGP